MHSPLRILHLEDDRHDAEIVRAVLESGDIVCDITRVELRDDFVAALGQDFDLVLADLSLPSFDGLTALRISLEMRPRLPFIFVSGTLGEEVAIDALKIGATDYILKERLSRIVSSVHRALRESSERAERMEAEQRLRRSEEFLAEGQRISHTGSWGWTPSSGTLVWSEEQFRVLGFEPGQVDPSMDVFMSVVHPEDRRSVGQLLDEAWRSRQPYVMSYRVVLADGAIRHLRGVGRPVANAAGEVDEFIGTTTDVSERVQTEARLRQAQHLEAIGTLAGGIAHDFNNILGAILGYGEMAMASVAADSSLHHAIENIMVAGERGRALVNRILAFSRSGVGDRVAVDVEGVVREALDLIVAQLPRGVAIETALQAGRVAIQGDPTQVHQVLMNLATNAIHAMPAGGTLRVSLSAIRVDAARIATIGVVEAGDYVLLEVADTGIGIAPDLVERIFDPFVTTREVGVGTGLGLSLVHGIVTELGGAIGLETTLGRGSTFAVYLPRAGDVADPSRGEELAVPRGGGQHILVVDDEEALVRLAEQNLHDLGYRPEAYISSEAALEAFIADPHKYQAVISDERMPGLTGLALLRRIRGIHPTVATLLVSGYVNSDLIGRARDIGTDQVIRKPMLARDLAVTLARALEDHAGTKVP